MAGLADAILNPTQVNVPGALDKGRKRQAELMANKILGETMGGKIGALAKLDAGKAAELSKTLGIATTDKGRLDAMVGDAVMATKYLDAGLTQSDSHLDLIFLESQLLR